MVGLSKKDANPLTERTGIPLNRLTRRRLPAFDWLTRIEHQPPWKSRRLDSISALAPPYQNSNFNAICRLRGSPASPMTPKAAVPSALPGIPNGGVFVMLNASARNCNFSCSFRLNSR